MFLFTVFLYFSTLLALSIYTQFLSDPNPWYGTLSGSLMVIFIAVLSFCYLFFLKHPPKKIWLIVIASAIVTFPAFPAAFSRDVYNYAMYAKEVVVYHSNPWTTAPKAFPNDELLNHIAWPNDPSRYGPTWVIPTTAIYFVWPSLYAFKLFTVTCFLLCLWFVKKLKGDIVFVALNPLMIIEFYIGTHTDIVMTLFILLAIYKNSWASYFLSIGTKITSLPLFMGLIIRHPLVYIWSAYLGTLIIIAKWSINPWYFTLPFILTALYLKSNFYKYLAISLSLAAVIRYVPLLYMGPFDPNNKIRAILFLLFMVPFAIWFYKELLYQISLQISHLEKRSLLV